MRVTRFRCVVCGKLTAGRLPRDGRHFPGDGSERWPRRHKGANGQLCDGVWQLAEWVDVDDSRFGDADLTGHVRRK